MKREAQLHELLAVEGDLRGEKDKIKMEATRDFSQQSHLFLGQLRSLIMFDDNRASENSSDRKDLTETVNDRLDRVLHSFSRFWDVKVQKESANQQAKADVEVDGVVILEQLPVTFLLAMEEELRQLLVVYGAIPTLQVGIAWEKDTQKGEHVYKTIYLDETKKTEKKIEHKVLVPATKEHPAQVVQWSEDRVVGKYVTESWSGMLSQVEKTLMISNIDKLLRAFKRARQRANNQEVISLSVGETIFNFIKG